MNNKILPFDEEAEVAVISGLLMPSGELTDDIFSQLTTDHFWVRSNKILFETISQMHQKSEKIDQITVTNKLKAAGTLEEVGGAFYVSKVAMSNPLASHAPEYAEIVKEKWRLRSLIDIAGKLEDKAYQNDDSKELLNEVESKVFKLSQDSLPQQDSLQSAVIDLDGLLDNNIEQGVQTGIPSFDNITGGLLDGRYYAIGGRIKQGKTAFACQIALNLIMRDVPGLYISLEMTKSQLLGRLASTLSEVSYSKALRRMLSDDEKAKFRKAYRTIVTKPLALQVPSSISAHEIRSEIRKAKRKFGIRFVVIDYIQKVRTEHGDVRLSVSNASEAIRATCKETGVSAIVVCQLNREAEKERPRLGHLKESGAIEQDADVVCLIFDSNKENDGHSLKLKTLAFDANRNGPQCDEEMLYDGKFFKFREKAKEFQIRENQ